MLQHLILKALACNEGTCRQMDKSQPDSTVSNRVGSRVVEMLMFKIKNTALY